MTNPAPALPGASTAVGRPPLARILVVAIIARLVHDLSLRVVYPFLPDIAAGLRTPIDQVGSALSLRSGVQIISPLFGALSDRIGHRRSMSAGLVVLAAGLGLLSLATGLAAAAAGFAVAGIGTAIYIPALLAYVSERTPYARRGRVLGGIELTWAAAGLVGVQLMALLIGSWGWRAPFVGLSAAALGCAVLTLVLPEPSGSLRPTPPALRSHGESFRFGLVLTNRSAMAFLAVWLLLFVAFENIQVGYAAWFESRYGLPADERADVQTLFSAFEIAASAGSALFLDRIGKKRGVTGGLLAGLVGYALIATVGSMALPLGLAAVSVAFLGFEFSVVSSLAVASEQVPSARGTMLATTVMIGGLGRMVGDMTGSALLGGPGYAAAALVSAALAAVGILVFTFGVREPQP